MFNTKGNLLHDHYRKLNLFNNIPPHVPSLTTDDNILKKYPIDLYKQEIINSINSNRILLIAGEAGLGKTTKVFLITKVKFNYNLNK